MYHFDILAILEPRISGTRARSVIKKLGFSNSFVVDAEGFSGGGWCGCFGMTVILRYRS